MKRKARSCLLCVCFFCFLVSLASSAADFETVPAQAEEEIGQGNEANVIAVQAAATPTFNFPDFDVNKIDLSTIPDSIRELAKSPSGIQIVYVFSNNFYVVVADQVYPNLILEGTYSGQLFLNKSTWNGSSYSGGGKAGYLPGQSQTFYTTNPQCFIARYSWTKNDTLYSTITEDWKTPTIRTYASYYNSDSNKSGQYYLTPLSSATRDSYLFGACCAWLLNNSTVKIYDHMQIFPKIFTNGSWYCETQIESYSLTRHYFEYGQFPTLEDQREQTQKSILSSLKSVLSWVKKIPSSIIDGIKSLFVPADGFFDTYFADLKAFFADRFGVLYDLPAALVQILQELVDYEPATENYSIHFPEVKTPSVGADGKLIWHTIISEQDYTFDFLSTYPFTYLYMGYRSFVWLAYCFMILNLIISRANKVFGGN